VVSLTPPARLVYEAHKRNATWGFNPDRNLFLSGTPTPTVSAEHEDTLFRYWLGVKTLLQLEGMTRVPTTITVEHDKRCQLACSYCYAGSNTATTSPRIDPARMIAFAERYQVKRFYIYGGDAFFDPGFVIGMLEDVVAKVGRLDQVYISTNALGLTPHWLQRLQACTDNVDIRVSTEPEFFGQRKTKAGPHQLEVLRARLADLPMDFRIKYTVVLSDEVPDHRVPFLDAVNELRDVAGGRDFNIRWAMVEDNVKTSEPLPWMIRWVQENWEGSIKNTDPALMGAFFGSAVVRNIRSWVKEQAHPELFGCLLACGAGTSNIAFHYDGEVYTCHGKAVDGHKDHIISRMTAWERWKKSRPMMAPSFSEPCCRTCPARQLCGLCVQRIYPLNCWFERERQAHGIHMLHQHYPAEYAKLSEASWKSHEKLMLRITDLRREVTGPSWDRLVRGTESLDDAKACYEYAFSEALPALLELAT